MDKANSKKYISSIKNLCDRDYIYYMILYYAAPTLEGIKPSNLITFTISGQNSYKMWNENKMYILKKIPLKILEIKDTGKSVVVLFYNEKAISDAIFCDSSMDFLEGYNYNRNMELCDCLHHLRERFRKGCPHEVGIFLGIPVEDVKEFIKNSGRNCLYCGYWKIYNNLEESMKLFSMYDEARSRVLNIINT